MGLPDLIIDGNAGGAGGPDRPVVLATFRTAAEAAMAEAQLRAVGIPCVVTGVMTGDSGASFGGVGGLGPRLLVRPHDAERASKYLPDSAVGRAEVIDDLDRQFRRLLLRTALAGAALAALTAGLWAVWGETGLAVGGVASFLALVAALLRMPASPTEDDRDDHDDQDPAVGDGPDDDGDREADEPAPGEAPKP
jgi:hypothetical protein